MIPRNLKILLANDDGIHADGIRALELAMGDLGEVWVVAPDQERSGSSQAITIRGSMQLRKIGPRHYTINGFPVDCVNVALHMGRFPPFDLVVSGINHGYNLGDDILYSGTVGAARHAAQSEIRSVAVSVLPVAGKPIMERAAGFTRQWIGEHFRELVPGIVYNINYPEENLTANGVMSYPLVEYTRQGSRVYNDDFEELEAGPDRLTIRLKESVLGHVDETGTDFRAVYDGMVSITPVGLKTTELEELERWKEQTPRKEKRSSLNESSA